MSAVDWGHSPRVYNRPERMGVRPRLRTPNLRPDASFPRTLPYVSTLNIRSDLRCISSKDPQNPPGCSVPDKHPSNLRSPILEPSSISEASVDRLKHHSYTLYSDGAIVSNQCGISSLLVR
eukprot:5324462-Amphidinium_carterae.1